MPIKKIKFKWHNILILVLPAAGFLVSNMYRMQRIDVVWVELYLWLVLFLGFYCAFVELCSINQLYEPSEDLRIGSSVYYAWLMAVLFINPTVLSVLATLTIMLLLPLLPKERHMWAKYLDVAITVPLIGFLCYRLIEIVL